MSSSAPKASDDFLLSFLDRFILHLALNLITDANQVSEWLKACSERGEGIQKQEGQDPSSSASNIFQKSMPSTTLYWRSEPLTSKVSANASLVFVDFTFQIRHDQNDHIHYDKEDVKEASHASRPKLETLFGYFLQGKEESTYYQCEPLTISQLKYHIKSIGILELSSAQDVASLMARALHSNQVQCVSNQGPKVWYEDAQEWGAYHFPIHAQCRLDSMGTTLLYKNLHPFPQKKPIEYPPFEAEQWLRDCFRKIQKQSCSKASPTATPVPIASSDTTSVANNTKRKAINPKTKGGLVASVPIHKKRKKKKTAADLYQDAV